MKFYQVISKEQQKKCYFKHHCPSNGPFVVGGNQIPIDRQSDYGLAMILTNWGILFLGEARRATITPALKLAAANEWVRRYPQPRQWQKDWSKSAEKKARQIYVA